MSTGLFGGVGWQIAHEDGVVARPDRRLLEHALDLDQLLLELHDGDPEHERRQHVWWGQDNPKSGCARDCGPQLGQGSRNRHGPSSEIRMAASKIGIPTEVGTSHDTPTGCSTKGNTAQRTLQPKVLGGPTWVWQQRATCSGGRARLRGVRRAGGVAVAGECRGLSSRGVVSARGSAVTIVRGLGLATFGELSCFLGPLALFSGVVVFFHLRKEGGRGCRKRIIFIVK